MSSWLAINGRVGPVFGGGWVHALPVVAIQEPRRKNVLALLGFRAKGREVIEAGEGYQVRESPASYNALFGAEKEDIGPENGYLWNVNLY